MDLEEIDYILVFAKPWVLPNGCIVMYAGPFRHEQAARDWFKRAQANGCDVDCVLEPIVRNDN